MLPWLALRYQREMDAFVLEGRKSALLLAAQGLATVLSERAELFDENAGLPIGIDDHVPWTPETIHLLSLTEITPHGEELTLGREFLDTVVPGIGYIN